ncbi:MAG TPA: acyl-CoA dehydrogenase family protein [Acidimicrobiia bacterium]|jgi:alkylation response protein AidB-like acyl-CoA dehydrogenase
MDFDLSADQVALRDGIRSLCEGRFPIKRVREGFDRSAHAELAEAGVFSLRSDGFGVADAAVVFEELGRAAVPGPLVWAYLAHGVVDGIVGGLEVAQRRPPWMIEHLDALDTLLVVDENNIRAVSAGKITGADPVKRPLDPLTPVHRVADLPAGESVGGDDVLARWRLEGAVVTAAFLVGSAQACTDLSVAYAKERRQFDRPIGSFQAIKHLLADMLVRTEVARASVHAAACTLDDPDVGDVARAVAGAKMLAGETAIANGKTATQVHGGMGFTWEVDVHLYLKRAWVLDTVFGSVDEHADAVAATVTNAPR